MKSRQLIDHMKMPVRTIDQYIVGRVKALLDLNWSIFKILKHLRERNINISSSSVSRIKNNNHWLPNGERKRKKTPTKMDKEKLTKLKSLISGPNPPTQKEIGKKLNLSQQLVGYWIKKLDKKLVKKPKVHLMTSTNVEKRAKRTYKLYLRLNNGKFEKYISSDEAWFYVNSTGGKRDVQ